VPLLGIVGNEAHERTLGSLGGVAFLVVQRTSAPSEAEPVFTDEAESRAAIVAFAARVLRDGAPTPAAPVDFLFEASLEAGDEQASQLAAAGWERRSQTEFAVELAEWRQARGLLEDAMLAAFAPWMPYFTGFDLTSREAAEAVHDEPTLQQGRLQFDTWLGEAHPEWLAPAD
jgi:hypothetical protein